MPTIFTRIIQREIPSYTIAEDDQFISFLDINPLSIGHALIVPKQEVDYFFDLNENTLSDLMKFAKKVSAGIQQATGCKRVGVAVIGFEVPHAHMHLVPMNTMADINFANLKLKLSKEEFEATAQRIRAAIK